MDVLECIHNLLSAGILSLFCLLCYLIHKCCCNVTAAGATKKTCFCGIHEITGQITPSNNIIAIGPNDVPFKQPLYKFLSKGAELKLPEPSPSCENCCESPCFSDIETSSSSTSGTYLDDYMYSDALPEPDNSRYSERNNEYMTNIVMVDQSDKYTKSRTRSYSYLEDPTNIRTSETTRRSSAPYDVDRSSSMRRASTPFSEPHSSMKNRSSEFSRRSSTPFSKPPSSMNNRLSETKRRSLTPFTEPPSTMKRLSSDKYIPTSRTDTNIYAVREDPPTTLTNKSSLSRKSKSSLRSKSSKKSKRSKRRPSRSSTSCATVKEYRRYDRDERYVEPEQEEHCIRVKVCVKGANDVSNTFNDKYFQETASGTKISIVGPSYVKQNLPEEGRIGKPGVKGPADTTESMNPTPPNYGQYRPAFQAFAALQQAYCAPKVVHTCCQQGQNYSGQGCKCPNIFGQLTRSACKCLPDNNNFMGNTKKRLSRLCCNCGCHKIKNNESGSAYDGQLDDTQVVYNNSSGEYKIKQNPDSRPNENSSAGQQTSAQEKLSNKSAGINNEEVIDEIKIKRIDCCCGETCPLKVAAVKKYHNVNGKHAPVAGGVQWLQASSSRPNSQRTADSYPEIDSGRGSSQRGTNDDCLTRLTDSSITRLYQKYGCDTTCSQSSSNQDVYADSLIRLTRKYGTPGSKQDDSGHGTNHPSYCNCVSCTENPLACFIPSENVQAFSPCKKSAMSWFDQECTCDDEEENVPPAKKFVSAPDKLGNNRKWNRYANLLNLECTCHENDILVYHTEIENEAFLEALELDSDEQSDKTDGDETSYEVIESENISVYEDCEPCPNLNTGGQGEKGHGRHGDSSGEKRPVQKKSDKGWFSLDCTCEEDEDEEEKTNIPVSSKFVPESNNLGDHSKCPSQKGSCGRTDDPCDKTCRNSGEVASGKVASGKVAGEKSGSSKGDTLWSFLADYFNLECHCEDDDDILIFSGTKSGKKAFLSALKQGQEGAGKQDESTKRGKVDGDCDPECPSITSGRKSGSPGGSSGGKRGREGSHGRKEGRGESHVVSLGGRSEGKGSQLETPRRSYEKAGRRDGPATKDEEDECSPTCPNISSKKSSRQREGSPAATFGSKLERKGSPGGTEEQGEDTAVSLGGRTRGKGSRPGTPQISYEKTGSRNGPATKDEEDECNPKCPNASSKKSSRQREESPGDSSGGKMVREGSLGSKEGRRSSPAEKEGEDRSPIRSLRGREGTETRGGPAREAVDDECDPKCPYSFDIKSPEGRGESSGGKGGRSGSPIVKEERAGTLEDISGRRIRTDSERVGGDDECDTEYPDSLRNESVGRSKQRDGSGRKEEDEQPEPIYPPGSTSRSIETRGSDRRSERQGVRKRPAEIKDYECDPECPGSLRNESVGRSKQRVGSGRKEEDEQPEPIYPPGSTSRSIETRGSDRRSERQGVRKRPAEIKDYECDPECPGSLRNESVGRSKQRDGPGRKEEDEQPEPIYPPGSTSRSIGTRGSGRHSEQQGVRKRPAEIKYYECDPECPDSHKKGSAGRSEGTKRSGGRPERQEVRKGTGGVGDEECDPECPGIPSKQSLRSGEIRGSTERQEILKDYEGITGDNEWDPSSSNIGSTEEEENCEPVCPSDSELPEVQEVQKRPREIIDDEYDPEHLDSRRKESAGRSGGKKGSGGRPEQQEIRKEPRGVGDKACDPKCELPERQRVQKRSGEIKDDEYDPKYPDSLRKRSAGRSGGKRETGGRPEQQEVRKESRGVGDKACDPKCPDIPNIRSGMSGCNAPPCTPDFSPTGGSRSPTGRSRSTEKSRSPTEKSRAPTEKSRSAEKSRSPTEKSRSPTERSRSPTERSVSPTEKSRTPTEKSRSPTERSRSPTERSVSPAEGSRSPTGRSRSPTEKSRSPTEKPRSTTEKSRSPTEKSRSPTEKSRSPTERSRSPTEKSISPTGRSRSPTEGSRFPGMRSLSTPGSGSHRSSPTGSKPPSRPRSPDNFIYGKERPDTERTSSKGISGRATPEDGVYKYIAPGKSSKSSVSSSQTRFTDILLPDNGDYQGNLSSGQCSTICSGTGTKKSTPGTSTTVSKRGFNKDFDNEVPRKRTKGNYNTRQDEDDSSRCSLCCKYLTESNSVPDPRGRCIECCRAIRERINRNKFDQQKLLESSDQVWPSKSKSTTSFQQVESRRLVRVRARSTGPSPSTNLKTHAVSSKIQIISNSKSSIDKSNLDNVGVKPLVRIRIKKYKQEGEQTDDTSLLKSIADVIQDVCICSKEIDEVKSYQNPKNVTDMLSELRTDPNVAWSETSDNTVTDNTVTGTTTDSATMDKYHITLEETKQMCPMLTESGDIMNISESTSQEDPQYGKFFPYKPSPCKLFPCPFSENPPSPDFPCSRPCPCGKHYCYPVPPNFNTFVRVYHQVPKNFPGVCDDRQRTGVCCEKKTRYAKDKTGSDTQETQRPSER